MTDVSRILSQGHGLAKVLLKRASTVSLDWATRQKSSFEAADSTGRALRVALPQGSKARRGDVLVAEDGSLVRVQAAPQQVLHVSHCTEHGSPRDLLRVAYQLGTQHAAVELQTNHLKVQPDPALADKLRALHLIVREETVVFEPEGELQQDGHGHAHDHAHAHAHHHSHDRGQESAPGQPHHEGHDHAPHEHGNTGGQTHTHDLDRKVHAGPEH
ncbi:MAG: urease accessory protein UreE [Burkholderiaceae bacterium]